MEFLGEDTATRSEFANAFAYSNPKFALFTLDAYASG